MKANEIIIPKAKEDLRSKIVVFDGNFYHSKQIQHLAQNLKVPYYIFTLKASLKTCIERGRKRKRKYGRNATKAVYILVKRFDFGTNINTENKTPDQVVKMILSHLPKDQK